MDCSNVAVVIEYCLSGCAQKKNRRIAMRARLKFKGMAGRHFLWSIESAFFSAALCAPSVSKALSSASTTSLALAGMAMTALLANGLRP
jgi:hypothetical protein